jgi:glycosyltransferase involved in cell wall biosynthesis
VLALLGTRFEPPSPAAGVQVRAALPNGTLMALLRDAKLAMLNGGSLLVQAIAQGTAGVAAPIADDQPERIERCAAQGLVRPARLDAADLARAAIDLAQDEPAQQDQRRRARELGLRSGLEVAVEAVARLLPVKVAPEAPGAASGEGRLRVMQVILSRGFAGSERAVAESCNAMCAEHDVTLVIREDHRSVGGASIRDHLDPRVQVIELPAYWRTRERLASAIRSAAPDVIHTHLRRGTRYVAQIRSGVPHVCTLHLSLNGPHYLESDGLICISRWQQDTLPAERPPQVFLIPNSHVPQPAVTPERRRELRRQLGAGDDDYLIGTVGRLTASKGIDVLLRAFAAAGLPQARLAIVGEGRQLQRLRRLADERVCFAGFRQDAKECFQAFDLFVSPSRNEPFGRVIIEAMDAGTPVIATSVLGPSDIARDYPIELVPPDDVAALAAALRRAASGARSRTSIDLSEFHVDAIERRIVDAYRSVIRKRVRA